MQAGFEVKLAIEVDPHAANSYRANFDSVELLCEDVRDVPDEFLVRKVKELGGPLGAVIAGLPCQGFSESNRRSRTRENPKNQLYREFLRILRILSPRWFVIENVAGITTLESGVFLDSILRTFRGAGFKVCAKVLDASDFSVPQVRRRAFIVGNSIGVNFKFPDPLELPATEKPTVLHAISDLPTLRNGAQEDIVDYRIAWEAASRYAQNLRPQDSLAVTGNRVSRNTDRVLARYRHIPQGRNWTAIPSSMMRNYKDLSACHTGIYYRLAWDQPSKVIGNFRKNMLIHPEQHRGLSIREAARLQSFPDSHTFLGPLNHCQQQVGDAVPPLLAEAVARAIFRADPLFSASLVSQSARIETYRLITAGKTGPPDPFPGSASAD